MTLGEFRDKTKDLADNTPLLGFVCDVVNLKMHVYDIVDAGPQPIYSREGPPFGQFIVNLGLEQLEGRTPGPRLHEPGPEGG